VILRAVLEFSVVETLGKLHLLLCPLRLIKLHNRRVSTRINNPHDAHNREDQEQNQSSRDELFMESRAQKLFQALYERQIDQAS
jgi:hypothetical protein